MLNTCELGFDAAVLCFTKTTVHPRTQGLQKDMLLRDAVLSLESCSNGVCGTCGLFTGRWPACRLTSTLGAEKRGSRGSNRFRGPLRGGDVSQDRAMDGTIWEGRGSEDFCS